MEHYSPGVLTRCAWGGAYSAVTHLAKELLHHSDDPGIRLFTKFFETGTMWWSRAECVLIARDMARLFDELRTDETGLHLLFPWGAQVLRVFQEAVMREGVVETD
jgi:hypothetical protein